IGGALGRELAAIEHDRLHARRAEIIASERRGAGGEGRVASWIAGAGEGEVGRVRAVLGREAEGREGGHHVALGRREGVHGAGDAGPEHARALAAERAGAGKAKLEGRVTEGDRSDRCGDPLLEPAEERGALDLALDALRLLLHLAPDVLRLLPLALDLPLLGE